MILCETLDDSCDFPIVAKCCCLSEEIVPESVTTIDVTVGTAEEDEDETAATLLVLTLTGGNLPVQVDDDADVDDEW